MDAADLVVALLIFWLLRVSLSNMLHTPNGGSLPCPIDATFRQDCHPKLRLGADRNASTFLAHRSFCPCGDDEAFP